MHNKFIVLDRTVRILKARHKGVDRKIPRCLHSLIWAEISRSEGERRSSVVRSRRPSLSSFASSRQSPELPPTASPRLPSSVLPQSSVSAEGQMSHLTTPSTDSFPVPTRKSSLGGASIARSVSPAQSVASSQYSGELGRPSIDSTQFEIVSPKIGTFL